MTVVTVASIVVSLMVGYLLVVRRVIRPCGNGEDESHVDEERRDECIPLTPVVPKTKDIVLSLLQGSLAQLDK